MTSPGLSDLVKSGETRRRDESPHAPQVLHFPSSSLQSVFGSRAFCGPLGRPLQTAGDFPIHLLHHLLQKQDICCSIRTDSAAVRARLKPLNPERRLTCSSRSRKTARVDSQPVRGEPKKKVSLGCSSPRIGMQRKNARVRRTPHVACGRVVSAQHGAGG